MTNSILIPFVIRTILNLKYMRKKYIGDMINTLLRKKIETTNSKM